MALKDFSSTSRHNFLNSRNKPVVSGLQAKLQMFDSFFFFLSQLLRFKNVFINLFWCFCLVRLRHYCLFFPISIYSDMLYQTNSLSLNSKFDSSFITTNVCFSESLSLSCILVLLLVFVLFLFFLCAGWKKTTNRQTSMFSQDETKV